MKPHFSHAVQGILFLLFSTTLCAQTYITNVTVIDVERHKIIPNKTVVLVNEIITEIGNGSLKVPPGATQIDGKGKFLMPGLVDAHVHFFQNGGLYTRPDAINLQEAKPYENEIARAKELMESQLKRYLRNGITTVIDPGSTFSFLKLKEQFKDDEFAPNIYMSGPLFTTYEPEVYRNRNDDEPFHLVKTVDDAKKMLQQQLTRKPDFVKIWYIAKVDGLDPEAGARKYLPVVKAIIDEAHKHNIKVAVHATERITAQLSVENGADYLVHGIEDELLTDDFVKLIKAKNVILCPTLVVASGYDLTFAQNRNTNIHELREGDPFQLGSLLDLKHLKLRDSTLIGDYKKHANSPKSLEKCRRETEICEKNLKKLSDAGVIIATGTDAGNIGTLHASSYLDEVLAMKKAGMSNWKIIEASTINGAKVLGKQQEFGSITKGKTADLILLDANPVDNIENLTKINRVFHHGIVHEPSKILPETPEELVQRQLNAYNFRNIEGFLETYSDDVELYDYPDKLIGKGKDGMRKTYAKMFAEIPDLHCEILGRIVQGNTIIDKERVNFGTQTVEAVAMYIVENGKIKKVYFIQ
ncbi:MAG: amidohydrolase [Flavobacterium sp.]|uniref:amidohydrolase family protein n=1 Tax=Flavobacterium sp. TaxID=239 RepID=UPI0012166144|nr:amidohydrolase family protein [Flavobacterium sp.]RZJ66007.1 MAG: amidohydrolase [Flavobacterium sp.]